MEKDREWGPYKIARLREKEAVGIRDWEYLIDRSKETKYNTPVIYRSGINKEPIEEWLENHKPSTICRDQGFGWIRVYNRRDHKNKREDNKANVHKDDDVDIGNVRNIVGLKDAWEDLLASNRQVCKERIFELAKNFRVTKGKWMLWVSPGGKGDHIWSLIAKGVESGKTLATHAKISAYEKTSTDSNHVVCIYNDNFFDEEQVYESERTIRSLGIKSQLYYKPNVFSHLDVYPENPWGIRSTIYTSNFDILKERSIIKEVTKK